MKYFLTVYEIFLTVFLKYFLADVTWRTRGWCPRREESPSPGSTTSSSWRPPPRPTSTSSQPSSSWRRPSSTRATCRRPSQPPSPSPCRAVDPAVPAVVAEHVNITIVRNNDDQILENSEQNLFHNSLWFLVKFVQKKPLTAVNIYYTKFSQIYSRCFHRKFLIFCFNWCLELMFYVFYQRVEL